MSNELLKQWQQDVADYGDNAYLLWEVMGAKFDVLGKIINADFFTPSNNEAFIADERYSEVRRKTSAALPFDLPRAKAGDIVQYFDDVEKKFIDVISFEYRESDKTFSINVIAPHINYYGVKQHSLYMKCPPKPKSSGYFEQLNYYRKITMGYKIPLISIIYDDKHECAVTTNNHICNLLSDILKRLHINHRVTQETNGVKSLSIEVNHD